MGKKLLSAVILTLITGNILFVNGLSSTGDRGRFKDFFLFYCLVLEF